MNALFVNGSPEPQCGVNQFGKNLYAILSASGKIRWSYHEATTVGALRSVSNFPVPDVLFYNWQGGQGGILADAPFPWLKKQCLCYHDLNVNDDRWDAIFFADPTMTPRGRWHVIGRPLPAPPRHDWVFAANPDAPRPWFGVHGFLGAWADQVVHRVLREFEHATIHLSLPFARYGDAEGRQAAAMADRCRSMVEGSSVSLNISHDFLAPDALVSFLASNDLNLYLRPTNMPWRGVSSAPDFALAAGRPLAVNRCNAFRHLHALSPSICVEDASLTDIFANGLSPLVAFKAKWCDPETIRDQVERVLFSL